MSSNADLRRRILKLIEEDEEFRLAVAGAVGLRELLEELRWLRRKSLEHDKRFEAIEKKLLEHDKRFEIIERKLLEHDKRFEAIEKKLLEHDRRFEAILEEVKKIWETLSEHNRRIARVEDGIGALAESMYSKFLLDAVLYELMARGERLEYWERNARMDDEDVDLLIVAEKSVYVVEVKVKPKHSDVGALLAKAELVERKYPGKRVVPVLTGARIGREVAGACSRKGRQSNSVVRQL